MSTKTLHAIDTEYCADCVEVIRVHDATFVACGTYQLVEESKTTKRHRKGRLLLWYILSQFGHKFWKNVSSYTYVCHMDASLKLDSNELDRQELDAILDVKWSIFAGEKPHLAVATSVGTVLLYSLGAGNSGHEKDPWWKRAATLEASPDPEVLSLSLDWSNRVHAAASSPSAKLAVSLSNGDNVLFRVTPNSYEQLHRWHAHELEAWITAFDQWNEQLVYTGADDCRWKLWDTRQSLLGGQPPVHRSKSHTMGVTSIQTHPHREQLLVTGSYDEMVKLWDKRSLHKPLHEVSIGGGVWRLKWHPTDPELIAAACMHGGFRVLRLSGDGDKNHLELNAFATYDQHESLAYGIDWVPRNPHDHSNKETLASCSFYDHTLHSWSFDL